MAKRVGGKSKPKATDGKEATGVEALRGDGYDKGIVEEIVDRIEELQVEIDHIMSDAKDKCSPHREDIDAIKKEAHEKGLPRKELNEILGKRRALRRIEEREARLSEEQRDNFHQLELALGMLDAIPARSPIATETGATVN